MFGDSVLLRWPATLIAGALTVAIILALTIGSALGQRAFRKGRGQVVGHLDTMATGLLGLLLAFNFNIAQNRFDARQALLVREADAIGTAYLRCSVLRADDRPKCREMFRRYVVQRMAAYEAFADDEEKPLLDALREGEHIQRDLWGLVSRAVRAEPTPATALLMDALNAVIDVDADRRASVRIVVPRAVSFAIVFACLSWALLLGYSAGKRQARPRAAWVVVALLISVIFGVALDFDRPKSGFITTAQAEKAMENLRQSMDTPPED